MEWCFLARADSFKTRPTLIITSDDCLTTANDSLTAALRKAGDTPIPTSAQPSPPPFSNGSQP
jgi:hypothetical protein